MTTEVQVLTSKTLGGLRVQKVQERDPYLNYLVYGLAGAGKTVLCGSADNVPSMRPVLFVDIEGGTESLRHTYPAVETARISTWSEMQEAYNELHAGRHEYQTVVLDSLTEIQKFDMYNIMEDMMKTWPDRDPDVPSMREWNKNIEHMRRMIRGFRDLPMHTLFTALMQTQKDGKTGLSTYKPDLSGKLADQAAGFFDIVMYNYVKQVSEEEYKRFLLCQPTEQHIAKDRTGRLPTVLEDPNMEQIFKHFAQD